MNSAATKQSFFSGFSIRFQQWSTATGSRVPLFYFSRAFAAIWLVYDLTDMAYRGTATLCRVGGFGDLIGYLTANQILLIVVEAAWLIGIRPRLMALLAAALRACETYFYSLNDFRFFCVMCLILAVSDSDGGKWKSARQGVALTWPRDLLVLQTGWTYFATGFLKLNPPFLSGGELYVRQNYLIAAFDWPFPAFYRSLIATLPLNSLLSWFGAAGEMALGFLFAAWVFCPRRRRILRMVSLPLVVGIHGFAAVALNVYFFGVCLVAQVFLMTYEPDEVTKA